MASKVGATDTICVPGQRICKCDDNHKPGPGTYVRNNYIHATLAGYVHMLKEEKQTTVEVRTEVSKSVVPAIGSMVISRVTNVNPRFCKCSILSVDGSTLREPFRGMIRKEDVRATEKDRVEMYKCFRPGDIVVAKVLTLGDAHSYLLTTAENEYGVILATSEAGVTMVPVSWQEMQCPKTLAREHRKVAKVQPQHIKSS